MIQVQNILNRDYFVQSWNIWKFLTYILAVYPAISARKAKIATQGDYNKYISSN